MQKIIKFHIISDKKEQTIILHHFMKRLYIIIGIALISFGAMVWIYMKNISGGSQKQEIFSTSYIDSMERRLDKNESELVCTEIKNDIKSIKTKDELLELLDRLVLLPDRYGGSHVVEFMMTWCIAESMVRFGVSGETIRKILRHRNDGAMSEYVSEIEELILRNWI